jgi:hypothetical protein
MTIFLISKWSFCIFLETLKIKGSLLVCYEIMEYSKNNSSKLKILKVYLHLNELNAPSFGTPFGKNMEMISLSI